MEKDSSDETVTVTTVVTVVLTDGRQLRLYLGGSRGFGRWVEPGGAESTPVGVQLNQPFVWYLQGVGDALAASRQVEPQPAPTHHACCRRADADVGLGVADALAGPERRRRRRPRASPTRPARRVAGGLPPLGSS